MRKTSARPSAPDRRRARLLVGLSLALGCGTETAHGPSPSPSPSSQSSPSPTSSTRELVATMATSCVLEADEVRCWGHADAQPWTAGVVCPDCAAPRRLVGDSASSQYCAITEGGGVWCRLDDTPPLSGILELATDDRHACARLSGQVVCWSHLDRAGSLLGTPPLPPLEGYRPGRTLDPDIPLFDPLPSPHARDLIVTSSSVCILDDDGGLGCHALPSGRHGTALGPRVEIAGVAPITAIAAGADTCVLDHRGRVHCWPRAKPPLGGITNDHAIAGIEGARLIAAGPNDNCAALESGEVVCWPASEPRWPRDCTGADKDASLAPEDVMPNLPPHPDAIAQIVVNACEACVCSPTGAIRCWGVDRIDPATGMGISRLVFGS